MGKSIGKYVTKRKRTNYKLRKISTTLLVVLSIVTFIKISKTLGSLYKGRNVENSKIEFYMSVADEIGEKRVQVNWQELLALDMVINDGDLTNIRKKDTLNLGEKFIEKQTSLKGETVYKVKSLDEVADKLNFSKEQKTQLNKNIDNLKYTSLSKETLNENSSKIVFINQIKGVAIENYNKYGILPSITVGQAILESGWGKSELTKRGNNLFGIKADDRWKGDKLELETSENYDDKLVASFREYSSLTDSIRDHGKFLAKNQRYTEHGLFESYHYTTQAQALEDAGYSTKTNEKGENIYADMLIEIIRNYNLQLLDHSVELTKGYCK